MFNVSQDKFTEYVFHITSITNICRQNHGHFSVYFRKKHFEFMAHSEGKLNYNMKILWYTAKHIQVFFLIIGKLRLPLL